MTHFYSQFNQTNVEYILPRFDLIFWVGKENSTINRDGAEVNYQVFKTLSGGMYYTLAINNLSLIIIAPLKNMLIFAFYYIFKLKFHGV